VVKEPGASVQEPKWNSAPVALYSASGNELSQLQPKSTHVSLSFISPQPKIAFRLSLLKFQYPCWTDFVPRLIMHGAGNILCNLSTVSMIQKTENYRAEQCGRAALWITNRHGGGERSLGGGHVAAVVGDLAEPGHAPQVDLGAVPEGDDDVAPLADEPRHDRHGRDGGVGEVGAVGAGEAGDDGDAAGREAVAQDEGARHGRQRQRQPQQGQAEEQVRRQVAVVRAAVEEHRLGSRVRGGDGESGTRGL
jgi:hypothetical protein